MFYPGVTAPTNTTTTTIPATTNTTTTTIPATTNTTTGVTSESVHCLVCDILVCKVTLTMRVCGYP